MMVTNTEGTILYVNPAFERITGCDQAESVGQHTRFLRSSQQDAAFCEGLWATIAAGGVWRGRLVNKRKDGTLYTTDATIFPVRDENGAIVNYVAIQRDVTREPQLEALKILFRSGYTDDEMIVRHGVLESDVALLQKPFGTVALSNRVRQVLDGVEGFQ